MGFLLQDIFRALARESRSRQKKCSAIDRPRVQTGSAAAYAQIRSSAGKRRRSSNRPSAALAAMDGHGRLDLTVANLEVRHG